MALADGLAELAAHAPFGPALDTPNLPLECHESEFEQLLAELALHHADLVPAGQAAPANPNLRLSFERIMALPVRRYGRSTLVRASRQRASPR